MTNSASLPYLTPEFDDFLFARINENSDETPLSVLSVLARLGVDPWEEAAKLAQLPHASAAKRLVAFIGAAPGGQSASADAGKISDRLLALLPSPPGFAIPARKELRVHGLTTSRFVLGVVGLAFILVVQLIIGR